MSPYLTNKNANIPAKHAYLNLKLTLLSVFDTTFMAPYNLQVSTKQLLPNKQLPMK